MAKIGRLKRKLTAKKEKCTSETKLNVKSSVIVAKKEKIKMRRQRLLKKIDEVQQMKKALKMKKKRKSTAIIGDTNPLRDALPSLEALLEKRSSVNKQNFKLSKKRGIEKQRKRKREIIQGIKIYESVLCNETFRKNPLEAITQHVQVMVDQEKLKQKDHS